MSLLSDKTLKHNVSAQAFTAITSAMIWPFVNKPVREVDGKKVISYGLSSGGYDVRLGNEFKVFRNLHADYIDPKNFDEAATETVFREDYLMLPPFSCALGVTVEEFNIPRNILVECLGKSTYARCMVFINTTPIEPGFKGKVVLEIFNASPLPVKLYVGEGIAQFLFHELDQECEISYADKGGKYQNQQGVQTPLA